MEIEAKILLNLIHGFLSIAELLWFLFILAQEMSLKTKLGSTLPHKRYIPLYYRLLYRLLILSVDHECRGEVFKKSKV